MERRWRLATIPLIAAALALVWHKLERRRPEGPARVGSVGGAGARESGRPDITGWSYLTHYEPFRGLPFTPLLTCDASESLLMRRFDWQLVPESGYVGWQGKLGLACRSVDDASLRPVDLSVDPNTVWAAPHAVQDLLDLADRHFDPGRADRTVVFWGTERPLSKAFGSGDLEREATVARLRRYFSRIFFQTRDIDLKHVRAAPMGLAFAYLVHVFNAWNSTEARKDLDFVQRLAYFEKAVHCSLRIKTRGVLASWGKYAKYLESPDTIYDATEVHGLDGLYPPSSSSVQLMRIAYASRAELQSYVSSPAAKEALVEHRKLGALHWWEELPKYRFLLSPIGSAIQTAKTIEALLVLTVPIIQRRRYSVHDELRALGFPLVVVGAWSEVTRNSTTEWWRRLSPRLESFRRNCLTVDGYWRIFTGQVTRCA